MVENQEWRTKQSRAKKKHEQHDEQFLFFLRTWLSFGWILMCSDPPDALQALDYGGDVERHQKTFIMEEYSEVLVRLGFGEGEWFEE